MIKVTFDQTIVPDKERYKDIGKLTIGLGESYITWCLLDYGYIKNHYRVIAVDLSRQKELDADPKTIQHAEFVGQFKNAGNTDKAGDDPEPVFVLRVLERSKETRLKFSQGSVTVL